MTAEPSAPPERLYAQKAMQLLIESAASNIPGVDYASITVRRSDDALETVVSTHDLAVRLDELQYKLREGPCYEAVTDERFVMVSDLESSGGRFPRFAMEAVRLGVHGQAAVQLLHNGEQAGLNLYARQPRAFDRSTLVHSELFSAHAAMLLGYASQVESLSEAVHTRQDIGTAVGIIMERYQVDRDRAFGFLVRYSQDRNTKVRVIAQQVIENTFQPDAVDE